MSLVIIVLTLNTVSQQSGETVFPMDSHMSYLESIIPRKTSDKASISTALQHFLPQMKEEIDEYADAVLRHEPSGNKASVIVVGTLLANNFRPQRDVACVILKMFSAPSGQDLISYLVKLPEADFAWPVVSVLSQIDEDHTRWRNQVRPHREVRCHQETEIIQPWVNKKLEGIIRKD
jgi:hypothetical protein